MVQFHFFAHGRGTIAAIALPPVASNQVDLRLVSDELDELAALQSEVNLLVPFENVGVICIGVLKRFVNISL